MHIWLPDAMEGPTPVSALIHAATMVTAGVFLLVRAHAFFDYSPHAGIIVAWVGAITALFAATIAVVQNDIKRVLAYSTISQLGYMFLAVGVGAYTAAMFLMVTHAFFKALLFLGSGSVIHGMHDEQDMRRMGGLRKYMPITAATFIVGWLAIAGIIPLAGFWSKDEILARAWFNHSYALWAIGAVTAVLTAFYMTRQVWLVFYGNERWHDDAPTVAAVAAAAEPAGDEHGAGEHAEHGEPHESPWIMYVPLVVLAGLLDPRRAHRLAVRQHPPQRARPVAGTVAARRGRAPDHELLRRVRVVDGGAHARCCRHHRRVGPCTGTVERRRHRSRGGSGSVDSPMCWRTRTTSTSASPAS